VVCWLPRSVYQLLTAYVNILLHFILSYVLAGIYWPCGMSEQAFIIISCVIILNTAHELLLSMKKYDAVHQNAMEIKTE
jgi:hypothetical protein